MLRVAVHQPDFLPWAGFWNKLASTDVYLPLDMVALESGGMHYRVRIKGRWISLDVHGKTYLDAVVRGPSITKARKTIEQELMSKANKYRARLEPVRDVLLKYETMEFSRLSPMNMELILKVGEGLGLSLDVRPVEEYVGEDTTSRLRCAISSARLGACVYYSGAGGRNYMDVGLFGYPVKFQTVHNGCGGNSVLQLIAQESDPLVIVKQCATWGLV